MVESFGGGPCGREEKRLEEPGSVARITIEEGLIHLMTLKVQVFFWFFSFGEPTDILGWDNSKTTSFVPV